MFLVTNENMGLCLYMTNVSMWEYSESWLNNFLTTQIGTECESEYQIPKIRIHQNNWTIINTQKGTECESENQMPKTWNHEYI